MSRNNKETRHRPRGRHVISLSAVLVIVLSAAVGGLVGWAADVEAGVAAGIMAATTLERILMRAK